MPDNCPRCGKPVRSTARFCHSCGGKIQENREQGQSSSKSGSKIFISPPGPVMDPPAAPDASFPAKQKSTKQQRTSNLRESSPKNTSSSNATVHLERRPEAPRRLERTGTQPISKSEDRRIVATEEFNPSPSRTPNKPEVKMTEDFATRTDEPWQKPLANTARPDPIATSQHVSVLPPVNPVVAQTAKAPVVLDQVMPRTLVETGDSMEISDFGSRLGAFILDFLLMLITVEGVVYIVSVLGGRASLNWSLSLIVVTFLIFFLINWLLLPAVSGQTIGKKILGIQIMRADGDYPGMMDVVKRHFIGYPISGLPLMLGFLWIVWDRNHQGWHDKLSKTTVVKKI